MKAVMRWMMLAVCAVALIASTGCRTAARDSTYASAPGPAKGIGAGDQRGPVLESLDAVVEGALGQPVELTSISMSIQPPFAGVTATPLAQDGKPIDYSQIPAFEDAVRAGAFDDQVIALLERSGSTWKVLEYEIGSTDFPGQEWAKAHGAPEDIFGQ